MDKKEKEVLNKGVNRALGILGFPYPVPPKNAPCARHHATAYRTRTENFRKVTEKGLSKADIPEKFWGVVE